MSMQFRSNRAQVMAKHLTAKKAAHTAIGQFVSSKAKLLAAVDTGNLRRSISSKAEKEKVVIGTSSDYGIYIEKGTGIYAEDGDGRKTPWMYRDPKTGKMVKTQGQHAQPFLRPAAENNKPQITQVGTRTYSSLMR
ncbi:HK97-gp10 family putative phage morphogenesis protein [Bacillus thuringiensis]|uniref:HK97-gp10 family putative phage morphogenesis protein n=1 Tax=Bacillus thuringiensis TaxID=1428 RepID=UPI0026E1F17F|nr:HK97-gp10 family putative phage morphogenesis protein [Bacillus thuringiensis]MDO6633505.1 HK97 gp10 family phage protein [Bacillus thuringiensis]MDO6662812.1 HK97 gp10 family phage protein [Bacillus thuringiensis]MDO6703669.1 HK97 gp10 family phage protein [Bacillus thuringiensis]